MLTFGQAQWLIDFMQRLPAPNSQPDQSMQPQSYYSENESRQSFTGYEGYEGYGYEGYESE